MRPAIVAMSQQTRIVQEETFAPILYTMPYSGVEDAIAMHNAVPQGLASSIFTTDLREAELFMSGVGSDCGIVNVNVGPSGAEIGGPSAGRRKPVAVGNRAPIHGRRICAAVPTRSITRAICHWRKGSGSTPHRSKQGPAVNLLLEAGLEILSSLQLPRVTEGGDDHIVVATAHVRIRARWSQKAGAFMESRKSLFVVIRRYGPPYDPQKPLEAQLDWEGHRLFMNALEAEGLARLAGPLEGTTEVLLVFRADSENEIDERLKADPWTRSGILSTSRIARWNLRLGEVG